MDPDGGNSYTLSTTSQMHSVPYALYAKNIAPEALPTWAQSEEKPVYNYTEIVGAPNVPTKVSELQNDANYITLQQVPTVVVPTKVSELQNDANYLTEHQSLADYAKKSDLPTVPTKVSDLTNDAGYITETNVTTTLNTINVSELKNDANYITSADVPTKVSAFENDKNYLTEHQSLDEYAKKSDLPTVPTKVSDLTNDAGYITESNVTTTLNTINVSELKNDANYITSADVPTKVSAFENDKNYLTEHQSLDEYAKKSELPTVPTKVSDLTNDAGYITETNVTTTLNTINVSELKNDANYITSADVPTKVSAFENDKNYLTEHQSLEGYAKKTDIPSLEGYAKKSELPSTEGLLSAAEASATYQPKGDYLTAHQSLEECAKKSDIPTVPTKLSDLTNDANYVSEGNINTVLNTTNVSELVNDANYITSADVPTKVSAFENDKNYLTEHQSLEGYAKTTDIPSLEGYAKKSELPSTEGLLSAAEASATYQPKGDYLTAHQSLEDYAKKSDLPTVPTKVSEFTNDAGYITESNVTTTLNTINVSELKNDANYITSADVPTKVSAFENDKNYLTEHQSLEEYAKKSDIPTVPTKLSDLTNDANYVTEGNINTVLNTTNVSELVNDANYITAADVPTKVSAFENDKNYLTEHQSLADYALKSDIPSLEGYAKSTDIPNLDGYAKTTDIPNLEGYAKKSDLPAVPTKLTDLTNDAGYITAAEVPSVSVPTKISAFENDENYAKMSDLPSTDGLLSATEAAATYQPKGDYLTAHQSLEGYALKSDIPSLDEYALKSELPSTEGLLSASDAAATYQVKGNYLTEAGASKTYVKQTTLNNYALKSELPSTEGLLSAAEAATTYQPKGEYLTEHQSLDAYALKSEIPSTDGLLSEATAAATYQPKGEYLTEHQSLAEYAKKSELPTIPTKVSAFENDKNYLTEHQSLDEYAKKSEIPSNVSDLTNDLNFISESNITATLNNINVSELVNDANYITSADIPTKVGAFENDKNYLTEHQSLEEYVKKDELYSNINDFLNDSDYIKRNEIPTFVSYFENDAQYIDKVQFDEIVEEYNALLNQYKSQLDSMKKIMKNLQESGGTKNVEIENGALPGLFSVASDKVVRFSRGNLQYNADSKVWRFSENQYDCIRTLNSNIASDYSGWIDLFGWATSGWNSGANAYQPYSKSSTSSDYLTKSLLDTNEDADWGIYNAISNGGNEKGKWHTLSSTEWIYLYSGRTNASKLRTNAIVDGVTGCVFFPDAWKQDESTAFLTLAAEASSNNLSLSKWNILESQGAVFLPSAGYRSGGTYYSGYTRYWTSTYPYVFTTSGTTSVSACNGYPVRLVQPFAIDVKLQSFPEDGGVVTGSGTYQKDEVITILATPSEGYVFLKWSDGDKNPKRSFTSNVGVKTTAYFVKENNVLENGALPGVFSVSGKKVRFSRGNLQYQANTGIWRFAENQYDIVGEDNKKISSTYEGWIDLFARGTSGYVYEPYHSSSSVTIATSIAGTKHDWGVYNAISNGGDEPGMWRTLTADEWQSLISGGRRVTINGIKGYVIFPDSWSLDNYSINDIDDWRIAEMYGAVFLPLAGYRYEHTVNEINLYGSYWSTSIFGGAYSKALIITGSQISAKGDYSIKNTATYYGRSVRLVQDVK